MRCDNGDADDNDDNGDDIGGDNKCIPIRIAKSEKQWKTRDMNSLVCGIRKVKAVAVTSQRHRHRQRRWKNKRKNDDYDIMITFNDLTIL